MKKIVIVGKKKFNPSTKELIISDKYELPIEKTIGTKHKREYIENFQFLGNSLNKKQKKNQYILKFGHEKVGSILSVSTNLKNQK